MDKRMGVVNERTFHWGLGRGTFWIMVMTNPRYMIYWLYDVKSIYGCQLSVCLFCSTMIGCFSLQVSWWFERKQLTCAKRREWENDPLANYQSSQQPINSHPFPSAPVRHPKIFLLRSVLVSTTGRWWPLNRPGSGRVLRVVGCAWMLMPGAMKKVVPSPNYLYHMTIWYYMTIILYWSSTLYMI